MEELVDLIASEASPSDVSDRIKDVLYAKSAERLDALKPHVANGVFADEVIDDEESTEQEE